MKLYNSEKEEEKKHTQYNEVSAKICSFRIKVRNMNTKGRRKKKKRKIYYKIHRAYSLKY